MHIRESKVPAHKIKHFDHCFGERRIFLLTKANLGLESVDSGTLQRSLFIRSEEEKKKRNWASLVAQWLRIRLPMQGTQV